MSLFFHATRISLGELARRAKRSERELPKFLTPSDISHTIFLVGDNPDVIMAEFKLTTRGEGQCVMDDDNHCDATLFLDERMTLEEFYRFLVADGPLTTEFGKLLMESQDKAVRIGSSAGIIVYKFSPTEEGRKELAKGDAELLRFTEALRQAWTVNPGLWVHSMPQEESGFMQVELVRVPPAEEERFRREGKKPISNAERLRLYQIRVFKKGEVVRKACVGILEITLDWKTGEFYESGCILSLVRGIEVGDLFASLKASNFTGPVKKALADMQTCAVKVGECEFLERYFFARDAGDRVRLQREFGSPKGKAYIQVALAMVLIMMDELSEQP